MTQRRAIFITGGGSGIGRAIARKFGSEGWFVGLGDIDEAGMQETAQLVGSDATFCQQPTCAIAKRGRCTCGFRAGGRWPDSAGQQCRDPHWRLAGRNSEEEITRCLDINLKGVLFGAQAAYPWLKASAPDFGSLNTASAAGIYGTPVQASTLQPSPAWHHRKPRMVNGRQTGSTSGSLCPSFIDTPLLEHNPNAQSNEAIRQRVIDAG
ncbi:MAG: SDR family NAD(P)-dependent oxidoreductase [Altererythrobacter sp.]